MKNCNVLHFLASLFILSVLLNACSSNRSPVAADALKPAVITEPTAYDTDDPAIWMHPTDPAQSLIVGTDKEINGGLYLYNLQGQIVRKVTGLQRPNNVDVAYGMLIKGKKVDVAITTERKANRLRIYSLPDLLPVDGGGIDVFLGQEGEGFREPMGIALYTKNSQDRQEHYAIVGRKNGPSGSYLWQYKLDATAQGTVQATPVRQFGAYSGTKEIEAIAVDNELGYVYYSDETVGVRKYMADPALLNNEELACFAQGEAKRDHEGIAIYKTGPKTGYILVSNQQNNSFLVYPREGTAANPHAHSLLKDIPVSTIECDGADAVSTNLGPQFPEGILVAMSNGKIFHIYDWRLLKKRILSTAE